MREFRHKNEVLLKLDVFALADVFRTTKTWCPFSTLVMFNQTGGNVYCQNYSFCVGSIVLQEAFLEVI